MPTRMFMVTRKLRPWRDRGAAAVEFAFVVGPLTLLIFGSIEFGLAIQARTMVENAAREGVRTASLGGTTAQVQAAATNALGTISGTVQPIEFTCATPGGVTVSCVAPNVAKVGTVKVTVSYTGVTGLFPFLTKTLSATSQMQIES